MLTHIKQALNNYVFESSTIELARLQSIAIPRGCHLIIQATINTPFNCCFLPLDLFFSRSHIYLMRHPEHTLSMPDVISTSGYTASTYITNIFFTNGHFYIVRCELTINENSNIYEKYLRVYMNDL